MPYPLVLAIEPDLRQAAIVKRIVREKGLADVAVVDSRDAALEAMRVTMPDVLLLSALMSPRDEDELIAHLRTLDNADHLQTHTIPQLASVLGPGEGTASRGLLSAFRRKRKKEPEAAPSGCDPDIFAEEIRSYLERAAEMKRERLDGQARPAPEEHAWRTAQPAKAAASLVEPDSTTEPEPAGSSSWASPFEWKPSNPSSLIADPESSIVDPESSIANPGSLIVEAESPSSAVQEETAIEVAAPIEEWAPVQNPAPIPDPEPLEDSRSGIQDSRLRIPDERSGMRDSRLGALATWARSERPRAAPRGGNDLRELLTGLAVPAAVVAVGYGRGCRIRRVRVPAPREPMEADAVGAVIISRSLLAEQRERREHPPSQTI